jgi:hypothetical protein
VLAAFDYLCQPRTCSARIRYHALHHTGDNAIFNHFKPRIGYFGVFDHVLSADAVLNPTIDVFAKIIYETYRTEWCPEALPWDQISLSEKEPNREASDVTHIGSHP